MDARIPIVIIHGETATGKTRLAVELCEGFGAEVVNADSMQVYRGMDIGTAKPTAEERGRAAFHLIDIADPIVAYSAGKFRDDADRAIREIHARGRLAIVAGGTMMYLKVLTSGLIDGPPLDRAFRDELKAREAREPGSLHARLTEVDPEKARELPRRDSIRIIRALEVYRATGMRLSEMQQAHRFADKPYDVLKVGIRREGDDLRERIERRVREMVAAGFVNEVRNLLALGVTRETPSMGAVGYLDMIAHIEGELTLEEAITNTIQKTVRLAKKQRTWHRADSEIRWFTLPGERNDVFRTVADWLADRRSNGEMSA
ncbi:MAG: tRNA (adenosine(37)-N6)-dimethylallyltransferase MiaA [Deltaproteobacteria bacterium]|nr:tRNA (adenosine(37)-N6)-dimethylallyltransferase MiaA [Deltaproteobacteria bacterium]